MCGHRLRVLQRTAVAQIRGDAGRPKRVAPNRREDAGRHGSAADHALGVGLCHRLLGENRRVVPYGIPGP